MKQSLKQPLKQPLPIRLAHSALSKFRYPAISVGFLSLVVLFLVYFFLSARLMGGDLVVFDNVQEQTGFNIIVSVLPPYFLMCFVAGIRLSNTSFNFLANQISQEIGQEILLKKNAVGRYWPLAILPGMLIANINVDGPRLVYDVEVHGFVESMAVLSGNFIIWILACAVIFLFFLEGQAFHQIGKRIDIDLYDLDKLNGFGRASLAGFLLVMGALALSTFQSLDQDFGIDGYRQALLVGVPSAIALTLLPSWSVHRRLRKKKRQHLEAINREIAQTSNALDDNSLGRMNSLLARRAIVAGFRTWPMDFSIFSRFVLYVFIPPLAWTGAALMEIVLDAFLAS